MIMTRDKILALLKSESNFISGEEISKCLGLSRMAVSAAVKSLRAEGYDITSTTNRGYKLNNCPDKLGWGDIVPYLRAQNIFSVNDKSHPSNATQEKNINNNLKNIKDTYSYRGTKHPQNNTTESDFAKRKAENSLCLKNARTGNIICLDSVDSTNNYLKKLSLEERLPDGTVVIANEQTKGRGRLGRSFNSAKDVGIYMSMLVRPACNPADTVTITAQAACAVHKAIRNVFGIDAEIKWVNDLILGGKKICGILTEMSAESDTGRIDYLIIGIGINVNNGEDDFPEEIMDIATSIKIYAGKQYNRARLAAEIIKELDILREGFPAKSAEYLEYYRAHCTTVGKRVTSDIPKSGSSSKTGNSSSAYNSKDTRSSSNVSASAGISNPSNEKKFAEKKDKITGTVLAINEDFSLKIRFDDGRVRNLFSGEVILA